MTVAVLNHCLRGAQQCLASFCMNTLFALLCFLLLSPDVISVCEIRVLYLVIWQLCRCGLEYATTATCRNLIYGVLMLCGDACRPAPQR